MYRPEGFYKLLAEMPNNNNKNLIEFVADAMLEALKYEGIAIDTEGYQVRLTSKNPYELGRLYGINSNSAKGYLVFIPREEDGNTKNTHL